MSSAASGKLQGQGKSKEPVVPKTCFQECFSYYHCNKVSMSEIQKNTNMQQCKQKKNTNHLHFQEPRDNLLSISVSTLSVFKHAYVCLFYKQKRDLCVCSVAQSCRTLCKPVYCGPPGSSAHGDSPGENTGVRCHALLQGIFPTQGLNPDLPHCRQILYCLSYQGSFISLQTAFFM